MTSSIKFIVNWYLSYLLTVEWIYFKICKTTMQNGICPIFSDLS